MNSTTYRGFEIERQADGFWLKLGGIYKFEAFATEEDARNRADAYAVMVVDAQVATIARLTEALRTAAAFIPDHGEGVGHTDYDCQCGEASARRKIRTALN